MSLGRLERLLSQVVLAGFGLVLPASVASDLKTQSLSLFLPAQENPQQAAEAQPAPVALFLTARDSRDHPIADLAKEDLRLLEDGQEQVIESLVHDTSNSLLVGLLVDESGSRRDEMPGAELPAASQFFRNLLRKGDLAFVVSFNDRGRLRTDLTDDVSALDHGLGLIAATRPVGSTAIYDAISWACQDKLLTRPGRRVLVIISDGEDNASAKTSKAAIEAAHRTGATIYFLLLPDVASKRAALRGRTAATDLSKSTGGHVLTVLNKKGFGEALEYIADDLHTDYLLRYTPTNQKADGKFRKITLSVTRKHVSVFAREGYYAPKN